MTGSFEIYSSSSCPSTIGYSLGLLLVCPVFTRMCASSSCRSFCSSCSFEFAFFTIEFTFDKLFLSVVARRKFSAPSPNKRERTRVMRFVGQLSS